MGNEARQEFYSLSDAQAQQTYVGGRRAQDWVGFLLPHLKPGMALLDCGCGVGSITLDLAERVAPGQVVGVDRDAGQLEIARANAAKRGLDNVSFEEGNVYALRFADESFDAVLAHTLLYHLSEPLRAIREFYRLVKPDGVAGISDDDWSTIVHAPENPLIRQGYELMTQVVEFNGGNPFYARNLRGLMLQAGFSQTEGFAVAAEHYGTLAETRRLARVIQGVFTSPDFIALVTTQGWASEARVREIVDYVLEWGERPDAFYAVMYCAAVGHKT